MSEKEEVINCSFSSEAALYLAYMPFVKGGGLFIRTHHLYKLCDEITLSVKLLDEDDIYIVEGKIVWITPKGAQDNKPPGIGMQFSGENGKYLSSKIENHLAGMLKSAQLTDTI